MMVSAVVNFWQDRTSGRWHDFGISFGMIGCGAKYRLGGASRLRALMLVIALVGAVLGAGLGAGLGGSLGSGSAFAAPADFIHADGTRLVDGQGRDFAVKGIN